MRDAHGIWVVPGDLIVYVVRHGSGMTIKQGLVTGVESRRVRVMAVVDKWGGGGLRTYNTTLTARNFVRVSSLPPDYMKALGL